MKSDRRLTTIALRLDGPPAPLHSGGHLARHVKVLQSTAALRGSRSSLSPTAEIVRSAITITPLVPRTPQPSTPKFPGSRTYRLNRSPHQRNEAPSPPPRLFPLHTHSIVRRLEQRRQTLEQRYFSPLSEMREMGVRASGKKKEEEQWPVFDSFESFSKK